MRPGRLADRLTKGSFLLTWVMDNLPTPTGRAPPSTSQGGRESDGGPEEGLAPRATPSCSPVSLSHLASAPGVARASLPPRIRGRGRENPSGTEIGGGPSHREVT